MRRISAIFSIPTENGILSRHAAPMQISGSSMICGFQTGYLTIEAEENRLGEY
jgi:hypothetical protein